MSRAKQPVAVDGIEFDALINQSDEYSANIPEYPIEEGFKVSDTIIINPLIVNMTLFLSNTPVTWKGRFGATETRTDDVRKRLEDTFAKRELITIVTTDKTYKNMGIEGFTFEKSKEVGYAYEIPITFKEVRVTETQMVGIPASYGKSGATGANAGSANTSNVDGSTLQSWGNIFSSYSGG